MKFLKAFAVITLCTLIFAETCWSKEAVRWRSNLQAAAQEAASTQKLMLLHFWIPGCGPCTKLDQNVFSQTSFSSAVEANFVPVKIDGTKQRQLAARYKINRYPADVVVTSTGQVVSMSGCPATTNQYVAHLNQIASRSRQADNSYIAQRSGTTNQNVSRQPNNGTSASLPYSEKQAPQMNDRYAENRYNPSTPQRTQPFDRYANRSEQPKVDLNSQGNTTTRNPNRYDNSSQGNYSGSTTQPANSNANRNDANRYNSQTQNSVHQPNNITQPAQNQYKQKPRVTINNPINNQRNFTGPTNQQQNNIQPRQNSPIVKNQGPAAAPPQGQEKLPPLALDGCCVMTLHNKTLPDAKRWAEGDRRWGAIHQGRLYLFVSQEKKNQFMANPSRYAPVLAGHDPVLWVNQKRPVPGSREHGLFYDDQIFLFSSEKTLQAFEQNPERFVKNILQATRQNNNRRPLR